MHDYALIFVLCLLYTGVCFSFPVGGDHHHRIKRPSMPSFTTPPVCRYIHQCHTSIYITYIQNLSYHMRKLALLSNGRWLKYSHPAYSLAKKEELQCCGGGALAFVVGWQGSMFVMCMRV